MKRLFLTMLAVALWTPLGMAQHEEAETTQIGWSSLAPSDSGKNRGLGDVNWWLDVENITGIDERCISVEFDGRHFWLATFGGIPTNYLFEITPDGTLVNKYPQPAGASYRDLAWDGQYLYAGDGSYIVQIDPGTGQPTGVAYPVVAPSRALAYDPTTDSFWTASFSSDFYNCQKDGTYSSQPHPGINVVGAAMDCSDPSTPMLWWWSQDGPTGSLASEYDPENHILTGKSFVGKAGGGGMAGGACAYGMDDGSWEFVGFYQSSPDHIGAHDLDKTRQPLASDDKYVETWFATNYINFHLTAGPANAHRSFGLFGTESGITPGTPLPGGLAVLPINWDWFTTLMTYMGSLGHPWTPFFGTLDNQGRAELTLTIPVILLNGTLYSQYAYCLNNPFDYVSNPRILVIRGGTGSFVYDDGTSENAIGWPTEGHACWMHAYLSVAGGKICTVSSAFGMNGAASGPPVGTPCTVYVWDDPTNDMDPTDAVLLASKDGVVQYPNTDIFSHYWLDEPVSVDGVFFVGCHIYQDPGVAPAPMDMDSGSYGGEAWFCGGDVWDPGDLSTTTSIEMGSIGYPNYFLLRINNDYK